MQPVKVYDDDEEVPDGVEVTVYAARAPIFTETEMSRSSADFSNNPAVNRLLFKTLGEMHK